MQNNVPQISISYSFVSPFRAEVIWAPFTVDRRSKSFDGVQRFLSEPQEVLHYRHDAAAAAL